MTQQELFYSHRPRTSNTLDMCVGVGTVLLDGGIAWLVVGSYQNARRHYDELTRIMGLAIGQRFKYDSLPSLPMQAEQTPGPIVLILALETTKDQDIVGTIRLTVKMEETGSTLRGTTGVDYNSTLVGKHIMELGSAPN